jgi:voltage-gated potassium channel
MRKFIEAVNWEFVMESFDKPSPYQIFMLALCFYALFALGIEHVIPIDKETKEIIDIVDVAVCAVFFVDFIFNMVRAPSKWRYFFKWGWIDLLSSIPNIDILRLGRASRILRIFQILRGLKATKILASFILERRKQGAFLAAALTSFLLIIFSSIAILHFEKEVPSANIMTAEDAVWWAVVTMTTVGFGDKYPVTFEGRVVAMVLMIAGVGLFGMFSGFIAAWFISPEKLCQEDELQTIKKDIQEIKNAIKQNKN